MPDGVRPVIANRDFTHRHCRRRQEGRGRGSDSGRGRCRRRRCCSGCWRQGRSAAAARSGQGCCSRQGRGSGCRQRLRPLPPQEEVRRMLLRTEAGVPSRVPAFYLQCLGHGPSPAASMAKPRFAWTRRPHSPKGRRNSSFHFTSPPWERSAASREACRGRVRSFATQIVVGQTLGAHAGDVEPHEAFRRSWKSGQRVRREPA